MKKHIFFLLPLLMAILFSTTFVSCNDDDDPYADTRYFKINNKKSTVKSAFVYFDELLNGYTIALTKRNVNIEDVPFDAGLYRFDNNVVLINIPVIYLNQILDLTEEHKAGSEPKVWYTGLNIKGFWYWDGTEFFKFVNLYVNLNYRTLKIEAEGVVGNDTSFEIKYEGPYQKASHNFEVKSVIAL